METEKVLVLGRIVLGRGKQAFQGQKGGESQRIRWRIVLGRTKKWK